MRKGTNLVLIRGAIPVIILVFVLPQVNYENMIDFVIEVAGKTLGEDRIPPIEPVMGGEDFAYFLQKVHGAFLFFGMGDGMEFQYHYPVFDPDKKALPQTTLLMTSLALDFLAIAE